MNKETLREQAKRGKLPVTQKQWIDSCIGYGHANNLECKVAFCAGFFSLAEGLLKSFESAKEEIRHYKKMSDGAFPERMTESGRLIGAENILAEFRDVVRKVEAAMLAMNGGKQ